ncbi:ABC transporter substrate-binding protein, partial [Streptomyces sp. NPDC054784]
PPDRAPTAPHAAVPAPPAARPSRRRLLTFASAAGVCAVGGGLAAWAASRPTGGGSGERPRHTLGLQADLSGPGKALGTAQERGVRLAVADHNSRADRAFDLALKVRDDGGDARRAARVAGAFAADGAVLAVLGPTGAAGIRDAVEACDGAGLPLVSVSCGTDLFNALENPSFFQLRPDENALSTPFVRYLVRVTGDRRTVVVDDRAAGRTSGRLAASLTDVLPGEDTTTTHSVAAGTDDFGPAAKAVRAADADAVVYAGTSPARAARCARALAHAGFGGTRMAREPVVPGRVFADHAGAAADGWVLATTYVDTGRRPKAKEFAAAYRERFGTRTVPAYAVEAYDSVHFVARGIHELAATGVERGALVRRLRHVTYEGLAKTVAFDAATGAFVLTNGLFLHRVVDGVPRWLGRFDEVESP